MEEKNAELLFANLLEISNLRSNFLENDHYLHIFITHVKQFWGLSQSLI